MGIAPEQPNNPANLAILEGAQLVAFGDYAPGWCLAAYQAAGVSTPPGAGGTWPSVRMAWGFGPGQPMATGSGSRIGGYSSPGLQSQARDARQMRKLRICLPTLLSGQSGSTIGNTIDPGDGLGARVLQLNRGDRLVVPARLLNVQGVDGDAVITIDSAVSDGAMWVAEGRF